MLRIIKKYVCEKKSIFNFSKKVMGYECWNFLSVEKFQTKFSFFFTTDNKSKNGQNHEKDSKNVFKKKNK